MRNVEGKKGRLGGGAGKGMEEKVERDIGVRRKKTEYTELCERKRQEENERWKRETEKARTKSQVWNVKGKGKDGRD